MDNLPKMYQNGLVGQSRIFHLRAVHNTNEHFVLRDNFTLCTLLESFSHCKFTRLHISI